MSETATAHRVASPELRAQIVQREHSDRYPRGTFLPYIHDAIDSLPQRVRELIDAGNPRSAEYWLLQAECAAGVISREMLSTYIGKLGSFHLQSESESEFEQCGCAAALVELAGLERLERRSWSLWLIAAGRLRRMGADDPDYADEQEYERARYLLWVHAWEGYSAARRELR